MTVDEKAKRHAAAELALRADACVQERDYPKRNLTPEHTLRGNDHDSDAPIHQQVAAAYAYVDSVVDAADIDAGGSPAWHGWALREAFLAGCSHAAKVPNAPLEPPRADVSENALPVGRSAASGC